MKTCNSNNKQVGFSLLEVLISLVILAIGLLGLAGLQAAGLKNNFSAYHRTQATQLAYDMADKMRSNMSAIGGYTLSGTGSDSDSDSESLNCDDGCSPSDLAQVDLEEWNKKLESELPLGRGTISPPVSKIYTISIQWDDNRDGLMNDNDPDFQVSFQL